MKCPRCEQQNPTEAKFCLECGTPFKAASSGGPAVRSYDELQSALTESLEQQTATGEILRVISRSPTDVQPVLDTVVEYASRLCSARDAQIFRREGAVLRLVAHRGPIPTNVVGEFTMPITRGSVNGRAVMEQRSIVVADLLAESAEFPEGSIISRSLGHRSVLSVPLMREGVAIGTLSVRRAEVLAFTNAQMVLLQTFADQAVIAIENVRLFNETKEALEQQTATAEILRVISRSPTDLRPTFDVVAESSARLCVSLDAHVFVRDGDLLRLVGHLGSMPTDPTLPMIRGTATGRAVLDGRTIHLLDMQNDADEFPEGSEIARRLGHRTILIVPLMRDGVAIGAIAARRSEARLFTERQMALLQTFADQAVIAIENVRLFTELQARNRDLTEALEQQTSTSEILSVISQSPTEVEPVFETIVRNAVRLCGASHGGVYRFDGELIYSVAHDGFTPKDLESWRKTWPQPATHASIIGQAISAKTIIRIRDVESAPELADLAPERRANLRARRSRSLVAVPMRRQDDIIGAIGLAHPHVDAFSDSHVELLRTFADQAVIAIENVRLFKELQQKNEALTHAHAKVSEALEQQTATSEILRVISRLPTDAQPVFDTIVSSAARLCDAAFSTVATFDGQLLHLVATYNWAPAPLDFAPRMSSMPLSRMSISGRVILERDVVHVPDVELDPGYGLEVGRAVGFRSGLGVPMLRDGVPLGVIAVGRAQPGPFSENQIELLKTFADQAVIAIENVRLFTELEARTRELTRSVGELTALGDVGRALSSTLDLETVLDTIVTRANQLAGTDGCSIYEYDEGAGVFQLRASNYADRQDAAVLNMIGRSTPIPRGQGVVSRAAVLRQPVQIPDIAVEGAYESPIRGPLLHAGYRAVLTVPLILEDQVIGALGVSRKTPGEFAPEIVRLLITFATQSALAIQNARLFQEIEDKSRQLEAASQHKSEFLANMSHELRTPLNAVIGFSEVLSERMFGDLNEKQDEYLKDIHASGQHLLSLINDILDLSKIEAGRMELELTDFHLPAALDNALTLVRERAGRHGIALHATIDDRIEYIQADERKIKQVLLNLLSNAIKFTPESGRIDVETKPANGSIQVSVTDTGVGIAPEDQEAIFEEFRQVGTATKKVEGTGLGLALSRKFIELHGGKIWVKSEVGAGSTFTFTIPVRRAE
jgi:GAF domain-containing protein